LNFLIATEPRQERIDKDIKSMLKGDVIEFSYNMIDEDMERYVKNLKRIKRITDKHFDFSIEKIGTIRFVKIVRLF